MSGTPPSRGQPALLDSTSALPGGPELSRIAFGSCNREDLPQPLWAPIVASRPQLWIWLGDNIYADTKDISVLRAKYAQVRAEPGYRQLMAVASIIGTWDDHDYGANDSGKEYPMRAESQQALLDFLEEPEHSPRRNRRGVYEAYTFGPPGRQVKVILLDVRYHRDPPGPEGDVLGEAQWQWLHEQLEASTAQIQLIGSGIQVIPEDHRYEKWSNFPRARDRLFKLIGETAASGVILLSGDRHLAEISRLEHPAVRYPIWEITSSGMTHSFLSNTREFNRHRVRDLLFTGLNFGTVEIDWHSSPVRVTLRVRDRMGQVVLEEVVEVRG